MPVQCHMHVKVYPLTKIVSEQARSLEEISKEVQDWLDASWTEKERQMKYFAKHQTFDASWNVNRVGEAWRREG